jgi:hypothetical protein
MPAEGRIDEELSLSGRTSAAELRVLEPGRESRTSSAAAPEELLGAMRQLESGLDTLVTRSEARFLPDSTVGSFTIEVAGREETLFFLVDEDQEMAHVKRVSSAIRGAVRELSRIADRLRKQER